jgi:hypothetical protein
VSDERPDLCRPLLRFTSHLVTSPPPVCRFDPSPQRLPIASALVTLMERTSPADQELARASILVTSIPLSPLFAHDSDARHATVVLAARAADRRSSLGSPASQASAVDWLSCSPRDTQAQSSSAVGRGCVDRIEIASGSSGNDAVYSSCSQAPGPSWSRIMPAAALPMNASGRPTSVVVTLTTNPARHRERYSISSRKVFTMTPEPCSRSAGINVHVVVETAFTMSRNMQSAERDEPTRAATDCERHRACERIR